MSQCNAEIVVLSSFVEGANRKNVNIRRASPEKLKKHADFQFWLRAMPIQLAAIMYMCATAATVMGLCKLLGEKRIALLFGNPVRKDTKQPRPVAVASEQTTPE